MENKNTEARRRLEELFCSTAAPPRDEGKLNGVEAANRAVANAGPGSTLIFLKRTEYHDLLCRAGLPELKSYKGKQLMIVSD
jgi:hypothetical protein